MLLTILDSAKDGLDPTDYDAAGLMTAMRTNDPALISAAATERFNPLVVGHRARPRARGKDRQNWHIPDADLDADPAGRLASQPRSPSIASVRR